MNECVRVSVHVCMCLNMCDLRCMYLYSGKVKATVNIPAAAQRRARLVVLWRNEFPS